MQVGRSLYDVVEKKYDIRIYCYSLVQMFDLLVLIFLDIDSINSVIDARMQRRPNRVHNALP